MATPDAQTLLSALDDEIDALARTPTFGPTKTAALTQQAQAVIESSATYIRAIAGTLPAGCHPPLANAQKAAATANVPVVLRNLQLAIDIARSLSANAASDPKPLKHATDNLLAKLQHLRSPKD